MLIMNRKIDETVVIGDSIEVTLVQVQLGQDQVRLGISAPRSIGVYRKELLLAITRENKRAAATNSLAQLPETLTAPRGPKPEKSETNTSTEEEHARRHIRGEES